MFLLLCLFMLLCNFMHAATGDTTTIDVRSSKKCVDYEREALLKFKRGIEYDHCGMLSSWGGQADCCQWRGIRCSNLTGHVTVLHLRGIESLSCLEGKVDSSLFELKHLKYLDLSWNFFNQTIPKSIDSLNNLKHLNLSNAGFFGDLPAQLGNLSKLEYINIKSDSGFSNYATSLQWLSHLKFLKYMDFGFVDLSKVTDWVQIVNNLPSLSVLHLDACGLPLKIPSPLSYINSSTSLHVVSLSHNTLNDTSIFQWLFNLSQIGNQLEYLDLSYNSLSGSLPSAFGKFMRPLTHLLLSYNQLEGRIPNSFSNMRSLKVLSLNINKFHGLALKSMTNFCKLQELDLSYNSFFDDMSNFIQTLSNMGCANKPLLEYLDLTRNQFWGSIPDMISSFSLMRELNFDLNQLNGTISQGIGQLSRLEILRVSHNFLRVSLNHSHFLNLSSLRELYLSDNPELVIRFPSNWLPPFKLDIINMRSCKLGPYFPKWLLTQTNVSYLDISNAQISDRIPTTFWTESLSFNLQYLNMSFNMIHGMLPNWSSTFDISVIDLSSNFFEGPIHSFLGAYASQLYANESTHILCPITQRLTYHMDLSNNKLSGKLPDCWMQFDRLNRLHLENNKFIGNIPSSFGALTQLQYLNLRNNNFSGELPESLKNCTSLVILDIGHNSLSGYIPSSLGDAFNGLGILNLRGNNFYGRLPLSLCQLSQLQILDIAYNHISGVIPKCIHNLTAMTKNMSNLILSQAYHGFIMLPNDIMSNSDAIEWKRQEQGFGNTLLKLVKAIDLSSNRLEGEIPDEISTLDGLISLDFSRNKLTGRITSDIGQLTSLELLDLSNNQLLGEIPISLSIVSSLGILDLSNNNLSGKIPLGTQLQGFDPSSYKGNPLLCGAPLQDCPGDEPRAKGNNGDNNNQTVVEHKNNDIYLGLYISVVLGFIIGFWGVCGTLALKRSWSRAFFRFLDDMKDKLHAMVIVKIARVWRKP